ncbi:DUF1934 domain-containing protein [Mesobacillus foraminis]|uniref:Uncharacterized beta-barrel protein YwiB (DUF1934 family) n=1 Tax=Mesobacillus foraminis TaxID=279826 RepID=A0A4R2BAR9_9BACI|nr:DUF1934 domain-containing protein [Mesobacillus foraminis]TCN24021.1 uncharacterized beta-barrel protein YwiB (DUF1934 family) [Mesobacillus foraminis]
MSNNRPAEQNPVKVTVTTAIQDGEQQETYELTTFGRYYKKGRSSYLQYDETMEEGVVHTTVKASGNEVLILRSGAIKMRLHLLQDKKTPGNYHSPYGLLQTEADTRKVDIAMGSSSGMIKVFYELAIQGAHAGTYQMNIDYKEERK